MIKEQSISITVSLRNCHIFSEFFDNLKVGEIINVSPHMLSEHSTVHVEISCDNCRQDFKKPYKNIAKCKNHFCNKDCKRIFEKTNGRTKRGGRTRYETKCKFCNKDIKVLKYKYENSKTGNFFCSNSCVGKYNSKTNKRRIVKHCEICNKEYEVVKSTYNSRVTCSRECQSKWQSINLIKDKASNWDSSFKDRVKHCEICNFEFNVTKSKSHRRFCSKKCKNYWFKTIKSQEEKFKNDSREVALDLIRNNKFKNKISSCQLKINELLDEMNLKYTSEKIEKYYALDVYLDEYNLAIEVMGTFWHADHRFYKKINYDRQLDRIKRDIAKNKYLKNKGIFVLYLWEYDINIDINSCKKIIELFIKNRGILDNYHSFNYTKGELNSEIETPFMNLEKKKIPVDILKKSIRIRKDLSKWTTVKCDNCDEDIEKLKKRISNTNFCNMNCKSEYQKNN